MELSYQQKKSIVINIILYERKQQAIKISSFLKNIIIQNAKVKKLILCNKILENIILIQKYLRGFFVRKKIIDYLSKIRTSYFLKSGIEEKIKNLQMIVFFANKSKIFDFTYDKFFEKFIFFMDRTKVKKPKYKIQFICDGRVIIDPQFPTMEDQGMYMNIIDFDLVKKMEDKHRDENNKLIKKCCKFLKKNNLSVLPKSFIESYLASGDNNKNYRNNLYDNNENTRSMNVLSERKIFSSKIERNLSSNSNKRFKSFKKITKLKGILKPSKRNVIKNNSDMYQNQRKVSFGWREEKSY